MANEINIQATLTVQKFSPPVQGFGVKDINQTNAGAITNIQNLSTATLQQLNLGGMMTNVGYLFVKNLDQTNNALLTLDSANAQVFALLRPNEFCLVPVNQNTIYGKSSASTVNVLICAAQI